MQNSTDYPMLRQNLGPQYANVPDARLSAMLSGRGIEAEAMEGFFNDVGGFLAKAAPTVLPIAGKVIGSIYGGPAGAAIGGQLGSLAGGAISNLAGGGARPQGGAPGRGGAPTAAPAPASGGAAGQLLQTITRPETLQALASMALGSLGKPNVDVGGTSVPVSAFSNLLGALAGRAEAEYNSELAQSAGAVPSYLLDYAGQPMVDPANAAARAEALYGLLGEAASYDASEGAEGEAAESGEAFEAVGEWESEADALEMLEIAEAESEEA